MNKNLNLVIFKHNPNNSETFGYLTVPNDNYVKNKRDDILLGIYDVHLIRFYVPYILIDYNKDNLNRHTYTILDLFSNDDKIIKTFKVTCDINSHISGKILTCAD